MLGLPRGGVPVAAVVATALRLPLDVFMVRKVGVPGHAELAMGAVASGGVRLINDPIVASLAIDRSAVDRAVARAEDELWEAEKRVRDGEPAMSITGRPIIVVDDGVATGASMGAAVAAVRQHHPRRVAVAAPVIPPSAVEELRGQADEVTTAISPVAFRSVGTWYTDFSQTSDREVVDLLHSVNAHSADDTPPEAPQ